MQVHVMNLDKLILLVVVLLFSTISYGDTVELDTTSGVERGFLNCSGSSSGVDIVALSTDIGSAVPSQDIRIFVKALEDKQFRKIFSLPIQSRTGLVCTIQKKRLQVFTVNRYENDEEAQHELLLQLELFTLGKLHF